MDANGLSARRWRLLSLFTNSLHLPCGNRASSFSFGWNHGQPARNYSSSLLCNGTWVKTICVQLWSFLRENTMPQMTPLPPQYEFCWAVHIKLMLNLDHPEKYYDTAGGRIIWMETKSLNDFREQGFPTRLDPRDGNTKNQNSSLFKSLYFGVSIEHLKHCPNKITLFHQITVKSLLVSTCILKL